MSALCGPFFATAGKPEAPGIQLVLELLGPRSPGEVETTPEQVRATASVTAGPQKEARAAGQDVARSRALGEGWGMANPGRYTNWVQNTKKKTVLILNLLRTLMIWAVRCL